MDANKLRKNYEDACNAYLWAFCNKHGLSFSENKKGWVSDDIGGTCYLIDRDVFVTMNDMLTDIDCNAPEDEYWSYYDYSLQAHELGFICPNYANWLRGCPRLSEEQIKSLREAKNRVYEAEEEFERILKEEKEKLTGGF